MAWCRLATMTRPIRASCIVSVIVPAMLAAAILTGGQARRLRGQDKSRLVMRDDGRTILERQLDMLAPIASEILIVTSAERLPDFAALASTEREPPIRVITD